jgi:hypothetical protein
MENNVMQLSKAFEVKLNRSLTNNEVEFIKWMILKNVDNQLIQYQKNEQAKSIRTS